MFFFGDRVLLSFRWDRRKGGAGLGGGGGGGKKKKTFKLNQFSPFILPLEDHEKITATRLGNLASLTN